MIRKIILFGLLLLFSASLLGQEPEMLKIKRLDAPTICVGGKNLKEGDKFLSTERIDWEKGATIVECVGLSSGCSFRFSKRQFDSKGFGKNDSVIQKFKEYFLRNDKGSTRGTESAFSFTESIVRDKYPDKRIALVLGNSNYLHLSYLRNPIADAESVANVLLDLGFDVIQGYDCTYDEMKTTLNRLRVADNNYDVALVYYAGHGIQESNHNYLIPIDNDLDSRSSLQRCILADDVVELVDDTGCNTRIIILDACRNVKTHWLRGSGEVGLTTMEGSEGMAIVLSTKNGHTALDGDGEHSPFAQALLDNINSPEPFAVVVDKVVKETYQITSREQYPVTSGSLISDFRFNPAGKTIPPKVVVKSEPTNNKAKRINTADKERTSSQKAPKNTQINQSLASFYSFDEKNSDDYSGNGLDGICTAGVQFVEDTPSGTGYAARINGFKKGYINIPYNVFAGKLNYSISLWIKDFDYGMIVTAISTDAPRSDFPRLIATAGNKFRFYTCYDNWDSTERFDYDNSAIKNSGWHHIVVTCTNTDDFRNNATRQLYVDGRLVSVNKGSVQGYYSAHGFAEDIIANIQIGGNRNGAYDQSTSMIVDNVRFYTTAISKQTVLDLYQLRQ